MNGVPLLEVRQISKRYGGVQALEGVTFHVEAGECLALMGGNGAGKSTLVSIITGLQPADSGNVMLDGAPAHFRGSADARHAGIETVYQTLALCDNLDAAGNLFLGREITVGAGPFKFIRRREMAQETQETLASLGVALPDQRAATVGYSGGQRQALAFARTIRASCRLLVLDEPTAALGVAERASVVAAVKTLRENHGVTVLLVTHNLEEMRELADRVAVLRNGRFVGTVGTSATDDDTIVSMITGSR